MGLDAAGDRNARALRVRRRLHAREASSRSWTARARPSGRARCGRLCCHPSSIRSTSSRAGTAVEELVAPAGRRRASAGGARRASATSSGASRASSVGDGGAARGGGPRRRAEGRSGGGSAVAAELASRSFPLASRAIPDTADCVARVEATLSPEPPVLASAGGVIRDGADAELDELRDPAGATRRAPCSPIEAEERARSGIAAVQGALQSRLRLLARGLATRTSDRVPADWIRKQSLANAERFVTPALKELEEKILGAEDRIAEIEAPPLRARSSRSSRPPASACAARPRRSASSTSSPRWRRCAAIAGAGSGPTLSATPRLSIVEGRHPLVERLRREEIFVPNDTRPRRRAAHPGRHGPEHGRQVDVPAPGRDDRAPRPGRLVRPGRPGRALGLSTGSSRAWARPTTSRAANRPSWSRCSSPRRSSARPRPAASSSSTRSAAAPPRSTACRSRGRCSNICTTPPARPRSSCSPPTTTS